MVSLFFWIYAGLSKTQTKSGTGQALSLQYFQHITKRPVKPGQYKPVKLSKSNFLENQLTYG